MSFSLWNDELERPLQHLRVLDLTVMLPGPYLTRLLVQYGADVVKIENLPAGDPIRNLDQSSLVDLLNQGKKSVAVNLKTLEGASLVRQMAGEADIFIENFREGVMDKLHLGFADISEENPDLLYMSLRGLSGKLSTHASHDLNFIATSGCGEWFLESGAPNYSTQFGDVVGGTFVPALKLLFQLANPNRRGMHLVSYMDESFRSLYLGRAFDVFKSQNMPESKRSEFGVFRSLDGSFSHSRYFRCRDNQWVALNAIQPKHWETFCEIVDRSQWKDKMWDKDLFHEVQELFLTAPSTYWEALTTNREVCLFRVIPWEEHFEFSQAQTQLSTDPLTWAGFSPNPGLDRAPELGRDTVSVLHSMGIADSQINQWLQNSVLFQAKEVKR